MKATIRLPTGAVATIEGTIDEVRAFLDAYGESRAPAAQTPETPNTAPVQESTPPPDIITEIVNLVKTCDDAEKIEKTILNRTSQVDRVLLPLYIVHQEMSGHHNLTTGQISEVTRGLGIPISAANASTTLSNVANKYVMTSGVQKRGKPTRYRINRRGVQYLGGVIGGNPA